MCYVRGKTERSGQFKVVGVLGRIRNALLKFLDRFWAAPGHEYLIGRKLGQTAGDYHSLLSLTSY